MMPTERSINAQLDLCRRIREDLDSAQRNLAADDLNAVRALAIDEARQMDILRALWRLEREETP